MKIAVMGAGGVGGYFGGKLAAAGNDVAFVARGAHLTALRKTGLRLSGPEGDAVIPVRATDEPGEIGPVDVVIFAVKLYDTETAAERIRPLVGPQTRVLTLQNGIEGGETLARLFGADRLWAGPANVSAQIGEPGVIHYAAGNRRIRFGTWNHAVDDRAAEFAASCNAAGFEAELVTDFREPLWAKFIMLATNGPLSAAARVTILDLYRNPELRTVAIAGMHEVAALARAVGAPIADDVVETCVAYSEKIAPGVRASICNDLLRGARIEVEGLSGYVVRLAGAHGIPVPINSTIYAVLRPFRDGAPGVLSAA